MCVRVFSSFPPFHPAPPSLMLARMYIHTFRNFKNLIGEIHNVYTFRKVHAGRRHIN